MGQTTFTVDKENLQVRMERVFSAPIDKVYEALTSPEIVEKWWGGKKYKTVLDKMDFRVGGQWRFVQSEEDGTEHAFRGEYKEIIPGKSVTNTFEYEPWAGRILTEKFELEEVEGGTKVSTVSTYANIDDLNGMVESGMETGARSAWEALAETLETK